MELEYPNPDIAMKAQLIEGNWLMCPGCIDAWEAEAKDGMVVCCLAKIPPNNA